MRTVPNQRIITVKKSKTDRQHIYSANNIQAMFEAMGRLTSMCGFKLYMYLAKNQDNYEMALSSADFCDVANCSMTAYNTAFKELESKGYLVNTKASTIYVFYDTYTLYEKTEIESIEETKVQNITNTEIHKTKVEEITISRQELYEMHGIKENNGFRF